MSRFTIFVHEDVSVAPLAKMLAHGGYVLNGIKGEAAVELCETPERTAALKRSAKIKAEMEANGEAARHRFLEAGMEP
jgi:hypothetical protein